MSNLFSTLNTAAGALTALQNALDVTQNNVVNASTPGYAKQTATLHAQSFQLDQGLTGGVIAGPTQSTRDPLAEAAVQQQNSLLGTASQLQTSLTSIQGAFDVSGTTGISNSLNQLYQAFSTWSAQPGNSSYQTSVLNAASQVAVTFQQASQQVSSAETSTDNGLRSTVDQINQDAATIRDLNVQRAKLGAPDAGLDAKLYSTLDDLSQLANIQVVNQSDGSVSVLLGGQTPLVSGSTVDPISVNFSVPATAPYQDLPPAASIVDANGADVTAQISAGKLQGLLSFRNNTLPSLTGGPSQAGDLNTLAKSFADSVNSVLASANGSPLFTYGTGSNVAATLAVNPSLTPGQLTAADPGPPAISNGIALKLANIDNDPSHQINGSSFTQFFANTAARVGGQLSQAQSSSQIQTQLVAQADALRQQGSGVSLDQEAVRILQLQSAYQAASKVVTVIDELTSSLMSMVV